MEQKICSLKVYGEGCPHMLVGTPAFSWKVKNATGKQIGYELTVKNTKSGNLIWNSGIINTSKSAGIVYNGPTLESNSCYEALVKVYSDTDAIYTSDPAPFETGWYDICHEWKASWLTSPYVFATSYISRKEFELKQGIKYARLFICGLGYYELYVNGEKIGDRYMDPAWTDFDKRVNYVAYDLKNQLKTGKNAIGVNLGSGWYTGIEGKPRPVFTLQLIVEYENGETQYVTSQPDRTWKCLKETWMLQNNLYIGEMVDARLYIKDWSSADFKYDKGTWNAANLGEPPKGKLCPMCVEPVRCVGEILPRSVKEIQPNTWVVDFGQNLAGIEEIKLHGLTAGTEIKIRFSEILKEDGTLSTENLRSAQECDIYVAAGEAEEIYRPSFTYHGFRYAEVTGLPYALKADDIKALVMRSDVQVRSHFSTSDSLINDIQKICYWTENNNLHSVPTDCPQRDERLGWLNDLTVRLEEAMFNFDLHNFMRKFLKDIRDEQGVTGAITDTAPYNRYGSCPADPVCSSYILMPWMIWKHHGDRAVLEYAWDGIKAWTDYLAGCRNESGIVGYSYYGDWAAPIGGNVRFSAGNGAVSAITPGGLMSTGFLRLDAILLAEIADELGYETEKKYYLELAEDCKNALNKNYLNQDGYYASNSQASNTFMLYLNVVPDEHKQSVIEHLVCNIREHDTHTTTGNICSRYIYDVLAENGQIDLAYELATQTTYPSWGYMLSRGATTTWERWEYVDSGELVGMASHDHPMYSTISGWFYKYLAGIRPGTDGFETFTVKPYIPHKLNNVSADVETVKGTVTVSLENNQGHIKAVVSVPFNSTCTYEITDSNAKRISLDGCEIAGKVEFGSGIHTVEYDR